MALRPGDEPLLDRETDADRLRLTFELHEAGRVMYRQRIIRENPNWGDEAVDAAVRAWLAAVPPPSGRPAPERWQRIMRIADEAGRAR